MPFTLFTTVYPEAFCKKKFSIRPTQIYLPNNSGHSVKFTWRLSTWYYNNPVESNHIVPFKFPLTLSLLVPLWVGDNTDLPSNSNISKTVIVDITVSGTCFKEYLISFLMISRLIDFALLVLYWWLKFVKLLESQNLSFSIFPTLKGLILLKLIQVVENGLIWRTFIQSRGKPKHSFP